MKKVILKLDLIDDKDKRKALKVVSTLPGIDSLSIDMKEKKLTVIGTVDPVSIVSKLRKYWSTTTIVLVGPAVEPEKKDEAKKEEEKKEEAKKDDEKKEGKKEEDPKKEEVPPPYIGMARPYRPMNTYYTPMNTYYYANHHSIEENPNACVIS